VADFIRKLIIGGCHAVLALLGIAGVINVLDANIYVAPGCPGFSYVGNGVQGVFYYFCIQPGMSFHVGPR
jgi:hypothetical protein